MAEVAQREGAHLLPIDEAVKNLAAYSGLSAEDARYAATVVPARLLGLEWPIT